MKPFIFQKIHCGRLLRLLSLIIVFVVVSPISEFGIPEATAATSSAKKTTRKKRKTRKKRTSRKRKATVTTLWRNEDGSQWIRKGQRGIIVSRDSAGIVRAMQPYTSGINAGHQYAQAINAYARALRGDSVRIYSIVVPSQGEYYMPDITSTRGAEQRAIESMAAVLDSSVTPVFVNDTLRNHLSEEIYSRTDHHWAPLGAYYGSSALAQAAGVPFRPLSDYSRKEVKNYVGTMYRFSGDQEVKNAPETFVYYMPPDGYQTSFINYAVADGRTVAEGAPHKGVFFRDFADGSGAAYCTFMGGDYCTTRVTATGGTPGRRVLLVKDSYGNAMAPCLFGSFEEVHVIDFRYFPHNLVDYIRTNRITDLVFVNCISIAFSPAPPERYAIMMEKEKTGAKFIAVQEGHAPDRAETRDAETEVEEDEAAEE